MLQWRVYPVLLVISFLIPFSPIHAETSILSFTFDSGVGQPVWSADGNYLAVSTETTLNVIDIQRHEVREVATYDLETYSAPFALYWSPDNTKLAFVSYPAEFDYRILNFTILDVQSGAILYAEETFDGPGFIAFSPDSQYVAMTFSTYIGGQAYESYLRIIDITTTETIVNRRLGGYMGIAAYRVAWHPDGSRLAIQIGGMIDIYDLPSNSDLISFNAESDYFYDLDWKPNSDEIVTYGRNIRFWNAATGEPIASFASGIVSTEDDYTRMDWLPDDGLLVASSVRGNVIDAHNGQLLFYYSLPEGISAYWSPVGTFAADTQDNQVVVYEIAAMTAPAREEFKVNIEAQPRTGELAGSGGLANWSPQGEILYTTATNILNLSQPNSPMYSITIENAHLDTSLFSDDGSLVAIALSDSDTSHYEIQIWDVQHNQMLQQLAGYTGTIYALEFNHDYTLLASGGSDTTIRVWDLATGEQISEMSGHSGGIADIAFSPDSLLLASVADTTMRIWDTYTGEQLNLVSPFSEHIIGGYDTFGVRFSPDGRHILYRSHTYNETMYGSMQVRSWDVTNETQNGFRESLYRLFNAYYSNNGEFLALTNLDANVQLIDTETHEEIEIAYATCTSAVLNPFEELADGHWVDFSPDSQLMAILFLNPCVPSSVENLTEEMFESNTIWLVGTRTGDIRQILRGNESPAYRMFFSPNGTELLTQHLDGTIKLWDVDSGEQILIEGL